MSLVAFVSEDGEVVRGGIRRIGLEGEASFGGRPLDRRPSGMTVEYEQAGRRGEGTCGPSPPHGERRFGSNTWSVMQRIGDVAVIRQLDVFGDHRRDPGTRIGRNRLLREPTRPEEAIRERVDIEVEIMDLTHPDRGGKQVQSDEDEGSLVALAIHADVLTLHEPHVGVKDQSP